MYSHFPSDGSDSRGAFSARLFYAAVAFSGVVGLVLLGVALSVRTLTPLGTSNVESSNLASRFSAPTIASLPGPRPWKDLAIAAMEASNSCDRDVSLKAHEGLKAAMAKMDSQSKALIARASTETVNKVAEMPGILPPLGFFDPLGFSTDLPQGKLLFYREVEIKHGRICMLAALGMLVAERFHPFFPGTADLPAYIVFKQKSLQDFWYVCALAITIVEFQSIRTYQDLEGQAVQDKWVMKEERVPGDLGWDPLGLKPTKPSELLDLQNKELLNGRLAMISWAGMIAQELVTKQKIR